MVLEKRLADSGHLESVLGLTRLEEEKGISCTEAIDACKELMERKLKLEGQIADLQKKAEGWAARLRGTTEEYNNLTQSVSKARQALAQTTNACTAAGKELEAINKRTEKERQRLEKEVEDCRWQANITKEDVVTAGKVKAEIESRGFTLETALDLAKDFAGYEDAKEKLAEALKQHGSLTKYLDDLAARGNKEKTKLAEEIAALEAQKKSLSDQTNACNNTLSQLTRDIAYQENLRSFYSRYASVSVLLERLASWNEVYFMQCTNPGYALWAGIDANLGNARFWTDKPPQMCPHCGYRLVAYDEAIYQALNCPVGYPVKLHLGE